MAVTLAKYEALGNDFLVLLDPTRAARFDAPLARLVCDRRRGVGADGLLRVGTDGTTGITMELRNADGGIAETSGNGLRCAVLAAVDAGLVDAESAGVVVQTLAGRRRVEICERSTGGAARLRAEMGTCVLDEEASPVAGWRAFAVDVGNPHVVLLAGEAAADVEIEEIGSRLDGERADGANVELVRVLGDGSLTLEVWERGAGRTLACGSGSCAAAAAAWLLGLVGDEVVVGNPGGRLVVRLSGELMRPAAELEGPARRVAHVSVDPGLLAELAPEALEGGPS